MAAPSVATPEVRLCACGCGRPTLPAKTTDKRHGTIKGQPLTFLHGHSRKGRRAFSGEEDRFWSKADKSGGLDACWAWTAGRDKNGYGLFSARKNQAEFVSTRAHRFSYVLVHGEIPDGLQVCHTCDNPPCVNPAHLWLGTNAENRQDAQRKGRLPKGENHPSRFYPDKFPGGYRYVPPESIPRGEARPNAKLTESHVREIRALYAAGWRQCEIRKRLEISQNLVHKVVRRLSWRHIE